MERSPLRSVEVGETIVARSGAGVNVARKGVKYSIVVGTRPEIIKMSPIIRLLQRQGGDHFIIHTGQHYSYNMEGVFFEQLKLPKPRYNLAVGSGTHAEETARILVGIEGILKAEKPDVVLVEGDTNSVLAAALAASKLLIKVGHVEAGLRSFDRSMPEEINRVVCDHLSSLLFAPTEVTKANLENEGIDPSTIFVTGNTIVDAVLDNSGTAETEGDPNISEGTGYLLVTLHRQENVDNEERLENVLQGLEMVSAAFGTRILFPVHPRTRERIARFKLRVGEGLELMDPLDYLSFLRRLSGANAVLTDSGGVQEEACILKVPCVTLRDNTERPETIDVGANILAGVNPRSIMDKTRIMVSKPRNWPNPFGDGHAAERIVSAIASNV